MKSKPESYVVYGFPSDTHLTYSAASQHHQHPLSHPYTMDFSRLLEQKRRKHAQKKASSMQDQASASAGDKKQTNNGAIGGESAFTKKSPKTGEPEGEIPIQNSEEPAHSGHGCASHVKKSIPSKSGQHTLAGEEVPEYKNTAGPDSIGNNQGATQKQFTANPETSEDEPGIENGEKLDQRSTLRKTPSISTGKPPKFTAGSSSTSAEGPATKGTHDDTNAAESERIGKKEQYAAFLARENAVPLQIDVQDISQRNLSKLGLQVRRFLKDILQTWSSRRVSHTDRSVLTETKKDIVKLLYKLRSGKLSPEMVISLSTIVYYVQDADLLKANQAYLQLSIGNVAWPIGVRDVGIHARAADSKIAGDDKSQLANIMKSDSTRRWLIAVKRVLNFCGELGEPHSHVRGARELH